MPESGDGNLGFSYQINKNGDINIYRHGNSVTRLRAAKASRAASQLESLNFAEQQLLMARLTGNYKRGNERRARQANDHQNKA